MAVRFPIDELFERLRAAGFEVSVADELRAYRVLDVIGTEAAHEEVRPALQVLLTSSEEEQRRFDNAFRVLGSGAPPQETPGVRATEVTGLPVGATDTSTAVSRTSIA